MDASSNNDQIQRHASYATVWQLFFAVLGTAIIAVPTTYYTLTRFLEAKVIDQVNPYEHLLYGVQLAGAGRHDDAVREFEAGFERTLDRVMEPAKKARLSIYLTAYLTSLGECEVPTRYRAQFERCRELFTRNIITELAAHQRPEGWYLLRVGELELAKTYFDKALIRARNDTDWDDLGQVHFDLAHISLCGGDAQGALEHTVIAYEHFVGQLHVLLNKDHPQNMQLAAVYPKYSAAHKELIEMLKRRHDSDESTPEQTKRDPPSRYPPSRYPPSRYPPWPRAERVHPDDSESGPYPTVTPRKR